MKTRMAAERLRNHCITQPGPRRVADVVAWLGAVQAQEYPGAKWALALRMPDGVTDASIEAAFNQGEILRLHMMRPTWHFVAAADIHWMLELTRPRVQRALAYAYRQFELDAATVTRASRVFERALGGGRSLTRVELAGRLARAGMSMQGVQLGLALMHAELEGIICSGPQRGKQSTFALLAERAPVVRRMPHDEALAELTTRYFRSHGPATARDFAWWSGLAATEIKRGLDICKSKQKVVDGRVYWRIGEPPVIERSAACVHLLPNYDEYLVAYRDREVVPHTSRSRGALQRAVVDAGQIVGTWNVARRTNRAMLTITAEQRLSAPQKARIAAATTRYGRFLNLDVTLSAGAVA